MKVLRCLILFIFSKCLWLYIAAGYILFYYAQQGPFISNQISRLYGMRSAEIAIIDASLKSEILSKDSYHRAIRYYEKLQEIIGPQSYIFGNVGSCYYQLGEHKKALEAYAAAISQNPGIYTFYADKAAIYLKQRKYKEAVFWLEKSINTLGETLNFYNNIIQIITRSDDNSLEKNILMHMAAYQRLSVKEKVEKIFEKFRKDASLLKNVQFHLSSFIQQKENMQKLSNRSEFPDEKALHSLIQEDFPLSFDGFSSQFFSNLKIMKKIKETIY